MEQNGTRLNAQVDPLAPVPSPGEDSVAKDVSRTEDLEKIRNILFGAQVEEYETRFTQLNDLLKREITHLRDNIGTRLDRLENDMSQKLEGIKENLQTERDERTESMMELQGQLDKSKNELEALLNKSSGDLQHQILEQSEILSHELDRVHAETNQAIEQTTGKLGKEKVDRTALSELLTEIALRLANDHDPDTK